VQTLTLLFLMCKKDYLQVLARGEGSIWSRPYPIGQVHGNLSVSLGEGGGGEKTECLTGGEFSHHIQEVSLVGKEK